MVTQLYKFTQNYWVIIMGEVYGIWIMSQKAIFKNFFVFYFSSDLYAHEAETHDSKIKSRVLYGLSQPASYHLPSKAIFKKEKAFQDFNTPIPVSCG